MEVTPAESEKERIRLMELEKTKETKEQKREIGCLLGCLGFITVLLIFGLFISILVSLASSSKTMTHPKEITIGMAAVLKQDSLIATTEETYNHFYKQANTNNIEAIPQMIASGQLIMVAKGTKVSVVDRNKVTTYIEVIQEGAYNGRRGYIPSEFIE